MSSMPFFENAVKCQKVFDKDEFQSMVENAMDIPNPTKEQQLLIQELKDCIRKLEESKI